MRLLTKWNLISQMFVTWQLLSIIQQSCFLWNHQEEVKWNSCFFSTVFWTWFHQTFCVKQKCTDEQHLAKKRHTISANKILKYVFLCNRFVCHLTNLLAVCKILPCANNSLRETDVVPKFINIGYNLRKKIHFLKKGKTASVELNRCWTGAKSPNLWSHWGVEFFNKWGQSFAYRMRSFFRQMVHKCDK